jgi:ferritin
LFDHLLDRGGRPAIQTIDEPQHEWENPLEAFEAAFAHEKHITESINQIADKALEHKDFATLALMQWFVNEQVEEEAQTSELVDRLRLANDMPGAIFILDNELKERSPSAG